MGHAILQRRRVMCYIHENKVGKHRVATKVKAYFIKKDCTADGALLPAVCFP